MNVNGEGQFVGAKSAWPAHFALPMFPDSDILGTYVVDVGPMRSTGSADMETNETPDAVGKFYENWFEQEKWKQSPGWKNKSEPDFYATSKYKGRLRAEIFATKATGENRRYKISKGTVIHFQVFDRGTTEDPKPLTDVSKVLNECATLQPDEAIPKYSEALKVHPDSAELFYYRGSAWYLKGDYESALRDFQQAHKVEPADETYMDAIKDAQNKISTK